MVNWLLGFEVLQNHLLNFIMGDQQLKFFVCGHCSHKHYMPATTVRLGVGPWLWRTWQSSCLWHQRSADRIPTLARIILNFIVSSVWRKDENKWKRGREWPIFFKKSTPRSYPTFLGQRMRLNRKRCHLNFDVFVIHQNLLSHWKLFCSPWTLATAKDQ